MNLPDIPLCHILCMSNKSVKFILNSIIAEQLLPNFKHWCIQQKWSQILYK